MTTYKKGEVIIKNFGNNRKSARDYYFNNLDKDYIEFMTCGYVGEEKGYVVEIIYKKNKKNF